MVFATDHLGHFVLAAELLPLLHAAARDDGEARLVENRTSDEERGVLRP